MSDPFILLDLKKINPRDPRVRIHLFKTIDSTNHWLQSNHRNCLKQGEIAVCLAEQQTRGRGRHQSHWYSPFAQNLYFSLCYHFGNGKANEQQSCCLKDNGYLNGLSLVVSLSTCKAIEQSYLLPYPLSIKWPNDVFCEGKKLAGILIELQMQPDGICDATIGIGINVNMTRTPHPVHQTTQRHPSPIQQPWTSIRLLNHVSQDRNILCTALIDQLLEDIKRFEQEGLTDLWRNGTQEINWPAKASQ